MGAVGLPRKFYRQIRPIFSR